MADIARYETNVHLVGVFRLLKFLPTMSQTIQQIAIVYICTRFGWCPPPIRTSWFFPWLGMGFWNANAGIADDGRASDDEQSTDADDGHGRSTDDGRPVANDGKLTNSDGRIAIANDGRPTPMMGS